MNKMFKVINDELVIKVTQLLKTGFGIISILFLATGCSVFSPIKTQNINTYSLNKLGSTTRYATNDINLLVTAPDVTTIYNTRRMIYSTYPHQIAYFAKNYWAAPPAKMLHPLIIRSLQNTHYFHAVSAAPTLGNYQYVLNTQLVELRQEFTGCGSWENVTLRAQLVRLSDGKVIATKEFSIRQCARESSPYGGVVAANNAIGKVLTQLSKFCVWHVN